MRAVLSRVLLGSLLLAAGQVLAQTGYPEQTVRILVGFTPGVAPDVTARLLAERLSSRLEQAGSGRERDWRGRQHRGRSRRQGPAQRLHARHGRQRLADLQPEPVRQAELRSGQGFRADLADLRRRQRPGGAERSAGEDPARAGRARPRAAGSAHLCARRRGNLAAPRRGAVQVHGRRRYPADRLSRHDGADARPSRRPRQPGVRERRERPAADPRGQAARLRGDLGRPLRGRARSADHGRVRLSRVRGRAVVRPHGAGGNAERDRRAACTAIL